MVKLGPLSLTLPVSATRCDDDAIATRSSGEAPRPWVGSRFPLTLLYATSLDLCRRTPLLGRRPRARLWLSDFSAPLRRRWLQEKKTWPSKVTQSSQRSLRGATKRGGDERTRGEEMRGKESLEGEPRTARVPRERPTTVSASAPSSLLLACPQSEHAGLTVL